MQIIGRRRRLARMRMAGSGWLNGGSGRMERVAQQHLQLSAKLAERALYSQAAIADIEGMPDDQRRIRCSGAGRFDGPRAGRQQG